MTTKVLTAHVPLELAEKVDQLARRFVPSLRVGRSASHSFTQAHGDTTRHSRNEMRAIEARRTLYFYRSGDADLQNEPAFGSIFCPAVVSRPGKKIVFSVPPRLCG